MQAGHTHYTAASGIFGIEAGRRQPLTRSGTV